MSRCSSPSSLSKKFLVNRKALFYPVYIFCHVFNCLKLSAGMCDITVSCDNHIHIPSDMASVVAVLVPMYGDCWLAYM